MGYIIKKGSGAGGGDATAANQIAQINQIQSIQVDDTNQSAFLDSNSKSTFNENGSGKSVFKFENSLYAGKSVFIDGNGFSAFTEESRNSVFKTSNGTDKSILERSNCTLYTSTNCISFQNSNPALLATDIQNWLQGNIVAIVQICYADAGGIAANPHTALIIYNTL